MVYKTDEQIKLENSRLKVRQDTIKFYQNEAKERRSLAKQNRILRKNNSKNRVVDLNKKSMFSKFSNNVKSTRKYQKDSFNRQLKKSVKTKIRKQNARRISSFLSSSLAKKKRSKIRRRKKRNAYGGYI